MQPQKINILFSLLSYSDVVAASVKNTKQNKTKQNKTKQNKTNYIPRKDMEGTYMCISKWKKPI